MAISLLNDLFGKAVTDELQSAADASPKISGYTYRWRADRADRVYGSRRDVRWKLLRRRIGRAGR